MKLDVLIKQLQVMQRDLYKTMPNPSVWSISREDKVLVFEVVEDMESQGGNIPKPIGNAQHYTIKLSGTRVYFD